jgi:hypothetical protein
MAYPTVSAPYGMIPVKMVNGNPYNGATRAYKIESGNTDVIFNGDVVALAADGYVDRGAFDAAIAAVGVFVGCSYTDPTYGLTFRNYYPGSITASDITAYVVDDPNVLFKMAVTNGSGVISSLAQAAVGSNVAGDEGASANGSTATGRSYGGADATSSATTNTLPFRIVAGVEETKNASGNFTEVLVKWNAGHQLTNATGI